MKRKKWSELMEGPESSLRKTFDEATNMMEGKVCKLNGKIYVQINSDPESIDIITQSRSFNLDLGGLSDKE